MAQLTCQSTQRHLQSVWLWWVSNPIILLVSFTPPLFFFLFYFVGTRKEELKVGKKSQFHEKLVYGFYEVSEKGFLVRGLCNFSMNPLTIPWLCPWFHVVISSTPLLARSVWKIAALWLSCLSGYFLAAIVKCCYRGYAGTLHIHEEFNFTGSMWEMLYKMKKLV